MTSDGSSVPDRWSAENAERSDRLQQFSKSDLGSRLDGT